VEPEYLLQYAQNVICEVSNNLCKKKITKIFTSWKICERKLVKEIKMTPGFTIIFKEITSILGFQNLTQDHYNYVWFRHYVYHHVQFLNFENIDYFHYSTDQKQMIKKTVTYF
jgi:hypothetical protein